MRRRALIQLLALTAATWPLSVRAQQSRPVVGVLQSASPEGSRNTTPALLAALHDAGYTEGRNLDIEWRWAEGHYERLPDFAAEFVRRPVTVIFAAGLPAALAAKAATTTIPIVFVSGADPVTLGLVSSMNAPGGNLTGVTQVFGALGGKRVEILNEMALPASTIAVMINSNNPNTEAHLSEIRGAARAVGRDIFLVDAGSERDIQIAFMTLRERRPGGLLVADDPLFTVRRKQIVAEAARLGGPAIFYAREFADDGGLMTYGPNGGENYRLGGTYVARILKGARAGDLPVAQPTNFELVINLRAAKALGLTLPPTLLARADEVIE